VGAEPAGFDPLISDPARHVTEADAAALGQTLVGAELLGRTCSVSPAPPGALQSQGSEQGGACRAVSSGAVPR